MAAAGRTRVRTFGVPAGEAEKSIAAAWPEAEFVDVPSDDACSAALVWDGDPYEVARFLDAQPALGWLHTTSAGLPPEILSRLVGRDRLTVTNGAGTHGQAVAEHVLALALAHYKRLPELLDAQRAGRWQPPVARELRGLRAGIVGLGDLGRATARLLSAFGTEVVGLRSSEGPVADVAVTYRPEQLDEFCGGLDLMVVAAPMTDRTRRLIGRRQLALMRRGAFLINVGRGPVVDEDALVEAIGTGALAGAALDVFATEPLPASSVLWSTPGVILTPHCADATAQTGRRCLDLALDNIARYRSGTPLRNIVEPARGY